MTPAGRVWLVLPEPLSARIFFDCGIVDGLAEGLGARLQLVSLLAPDRTADWDGVRATSMLHRDELLPWQVGLPEKALRRVTRRR